MATVAESVLPARPTITFSSGRELLARSGKFLHRAAAGIADAEILVDLGDSIGSGRWWRGMATVLLLSGAVVVMGTRVPRLVGPVPMLPAAAVLEEMRPSAIQPLATGSLTGKRVAPTVMVERLSEIPERPRLELSGRVAGDGLEAALRRSGVGQADLVAVRNLLQPMVRSSAVARGTDLDLVLGRRNSKADPRPLESLAFRAAFEFRVEISRNAAGDLVIRRIPIRIDHTPLRVTGLVGASLDHAMRAAGVPATVIADYRRQMGRAIDMRRDVGRRDRFDVIIANERAETGESRMGPLLYAGLVNGRSNVSLMRWGSKGEFFWQTGESLDKGLLRLPLNGARLSSNFGTRRHPVLGQTRMHSGVDLAAPTGTPIYAAAAGRVSFAGWNGGYGNLVIINHGNGLSTRYGHMSRISVKQGQQVTQGQTIGAVGQTGLATGPHVHYEVRKNNVATNPGQRVYTGGRQLAGAELQQFRREMTRLKTLTEAG